MPLDPTPSPRDLPVLPDDLGSAPRAWQRRTVRQVDAAEGVREHFLPAFRSFADDMIWSAISQFPASRSEFTLIIPVHNEEHTLPQLFAALDQVLLPKSVPAQIIFAANGCTDGTVRAAERYLASFGEVEQGWAGGNRVRCVERDAQSIVLLDIPTAGKANALTLANELALQRGHRVAICFDADTLPEPRSLAHLYGDAADLFSDPERRVGVIAGTPVLVEQRLIAVAGEERHRDAWAYVPKPPTENWVSGCIFAWRPELVAMHGGFPPTKIEDYGLSLLARLRGYEIVRSDARMWARHSFSDGNARIQVERFAYGLEQLKRYFADEPRALELIRADHWYACSTAQGVRRSVNAVVGSFFGALSRYTLMKEDVPESLRKIIEGDDIEGVKGAFSAIEDLVAWSFRRLMLAVREHRVLIPLALSCARRQWEFRREALLGAREGRRKFSTYGEELVWERVDATRRGAY